MAVDFTLFENKLTNNKNDYYARIMNSKTVDQQHLIKRMTLPGGMTLAHAKAVLAEYQFQLMLLLEEGYVVNDGLIRYKPGISGIFNNADDVFDPERHQKTVSTSPTKTLKEAVNEMELNRVKPQFIKMEIHSFTDLLTEERDKSITPGHMSMIKGKHLVFDKTDTVQGIFLVDESKNEVRCGQYGIINPSSIIFVIPSDISEGIYDIEVRSRKDALSKLHKAQFRKFLRCKLD